MQLAYAISGYKQPGQFRWLLAAIWDPRDVFAVHIDARTPEPVFAEFRRNAEMGCPVKIVLSDHHYWGGLRATQRLSTLCKTFDLGLSMHSNSHLGISLVAMAHLCASVPLLTYACDTHYPWQDEEVVEGGRLRFEQGSLRVPTAPGLGVTLEREALARLHDNYLRCGIRNRDDLAQMRKYDPAFTGRQPRF